MINNKNALTILCFGDSNTFGTNPDDWSRYPIDVRWTGRLQRQLGDDFSIIEEGLGGRTTDLEHPDPTKPSRDGLNYFKPCFESHEPVDIVVIMLGSNDLKTVYKRIPNDIVRVLRDYCAFIQQRSNTTKIILVSPIAFTVKNTNTVFEKKAEQYSIDMIPLLRTAADELKVTFYDSNKVTEAGQDGLHWTEQSHARFATAMASIIKEIL